MHTSTLPISSLPSAADISGYKSFQPSDTTVQPDLVTRAQAGSHDAFSELYTMHKKRVFSICMRMVRDPSLAEDLTQETFLLLHRKLNMFRGESAFTTWLHRLAVNIVLMHLRKRALTVVSLDHLMANLPEERAGREFGTRDLTQAGTVDRLTIERAIANLSPGYRSIFILHDIQGFDHCEIASMLKCTCGNTKSQLYNARRVLRSALAAKANSGESAAPAKNAFQPRIRTRGQRGSERSTALQTRVA